MKLQELSLAELARQLRRPGLNIQTGPFVVHLQTGMARVTEGLSQLYCDFPIAQSDDVADFHVSISPPHNHRRWILRQVICAFDGETPFQPLPQEQAYPLFETSLNWYIYAEVYNYLILHAASVERNGYAVVLPAPPGSGKSTLTAALVNRGWRLLTDELTLVSLETLAIVPLARPISLKNKAIEVIKCFAPDSIMAGECHGTIKGTVAYMRPPSESVARMHERAVARWLILPKYEPDAALSINVMGKAEAFMKLAEGLVNYAVLGRAGFEVLTSLIDRTDCYEFKYGDLDAAIAWFDQLNPPLTRAAEHAVRQ